jgi:hypothetical protein
VTTQISAAASSRPEIAAKVRGYMVSLHTLSFPRGSLIKGEILRKLIVISVLGLAAAVGLFVSGCGSGGDSADGQQIDKATFVEQANRICQQASGKMAAAIESISNQESAKPGYDYEKTQVVLVEKGLVPALEEELQEIQALGLPDEAKKEAEALGEAYRRSIKKTKGDPEGAAGYSIPYEEIELAGARFGISECPVAPVNGN